MKKYEQIGTFQWKGHFIRLGAIGDSFDIYPDEEVGEPPFPSVTIHGREEHTTELVGLITINFEKAETPA